MNRWTAAGLWAAVAVGCGVLLSARQLPDDPARQFGVGITGSFEGWFDYPDGSHGFLIGYLNRNRSQEEDIPIGPNNHIDPGGPDMGQPTHFLAGRQTGFFVVTVPKSFPTTQRLTWTITVNRETNTIPFTFKPTYNISPFEDSTIHNTPPVLHLFDEKAPAIQGPTLPLSKAPTRTTSVSQPLELPVWAEDDAKFISNSGTPAGRGRTPVSLSWTKYRGPGNVTFDKARPEVKTLAGGAPNEPFRGQSSATAKFDKPGDYVLHVLGNDYSGTSVEVCCWTPALVKVTVTP